MITYQSRAPDMDGRGRCPYVQMLKPQEVVQMAVSICERLGFGACDAKIIQKRMRKRLPTILEHAGSRRGSTDITLRWKMILPRAFDICT